MVIWPYFFSCLAQSDKGRGILALVLLAHSRIYMLKRKSANYWTQSFTFLVTPPISVVVPSYFIFTAIIIVASAFPRTLLDSVTATEETSVIHTTRRGNDVVKCDLIIEDGALILSWKLWKWLLNYRVNNMKRFQTMTFFVQNRPVAIGLSSLPSF